MVQISAGAMSKTRNISDNTMRCESTEHSDHTNIKTMLPGNMPGSIVRLSVHPAVANTVRSPSGNDEKTVVIHLFTQPVRHFRARLDTPGIGSADPGLHEVDIHSQPIG